MNAAVLAVIFSGLLLAQRPPATPDAEFVSAVSAGSLGQIKLSQLAQQKTKHDGVRQIASRVVTDRTKLEEELKSLASHAELSLTGVASTKDSVVYDTLTAISGSTFDNAYLSAVVTDHREDVAAFEKEEMTGTNQEIKSFASRWLPALRELLTQAEKLANQMGTTPPTPTGGR